jgi:Tfp pilus assembly protein PilZ
LKHTVPHGYDCPVSSSQPRYPAHLRVILSDEEVRSVETANISAGGMFVHTDRDLPVGSTLSVEVSLPDDQRPTPVNVKIVHAVPPHALPSERGVGMQFVGPDDTFRERLDEYLTSITTKTRVPIRVLLVARDLLHEKGWTQLDARDHVGRYCLSGALSAAAGDDRTAYRAALRSLNTRLPEPGCPFGGVDCHCAVLRWNDREGRTKHEVVAKLDEVIESALAQAG